MIIEKDIIKKIEEDFQIDSEKALTILNKNINENECINHPRIIRSIIYLSNGSLFELKHNIKTAISDWRDVLYFAEYEKKNGSSTSNRVRDFNLTFDETDL
ncbi:hypothetical protein [Changchengzhania lutea]|uniref:hypothetical protein n=1 Tax=Changchengzhania lutea TaxID=2049305 RepID=UPI00115D4E00|nr:hypothetical protein [Changchengzhania lutea]